MSSLRIKPEVRRPSGGFNYIKADDEGYLIIREGMTPSPEYILGETEFVFPNSAVINYGEEVVITKPLNSYYGKYMVYVNNPSPDTTLRLSVRNGTSYPNATQYGEVYTATVPVSTYTLFSATAWSSCFTSINNVLSDESGDLNDINVAGDVPFTFGAANDAIYFGNSSKFQRMRLNIGTPGVYNATMIWEYWNGSIWTDIPIVIDNTALTANKPFTKSGWNTVSLQVPTDWAAYDIPSDPTSQYWIRARVNSYTGITTGPALSQGYFKPTPFANTYGYMVEGMFNGADVKITLGNNTAVPATGGFTAKIWVKEY